jgi:hypothetical protein
MAPRALKAENTCNKHNSSGKKILRLMDRICRSMIHGNSNAV